MPVTIYFVDRVSCIPIDCLHCYGYHHNEIEAFLDAPYVPYDIASSIQRGISKRKKKPKIQYVMYEIIVCAL